MFSVCWTEKTRIIKTKQKRNETADSLRIPNSLMLTKKGKKERETNQTKNKNKTKTFQISNTTKIIK
jgi:hypothetical protein